MKRRAQPTEAQRRAEGLDATDVVRLPLLGCRVRLLFFGGGGCGKTRIIVSVLAKLSRRFYGPKGFVLIPCLPKRFARFSGGTTTHGLIKLQGGQSVNAAHLLVQHDKQRRALTAVWAPGWALVKHACAQPRAALEHALTARAMHGRE